MVKGAFASLRNTHEFFEAPGAVQMRDTFEWRSPLGLLGLLADKLFVERHLRAFLVEKQSALARYAEEQVAKQAGSEAGR